MLKTNISWNWEKTKRWNQESVLCIGGWPGGTGGNCVVKWTCLWIWFWFYRIVLIPSLIYTFTEILIKLNTGRSTAAEDTPLDVSCSDRLDLQTNYVLGKKEFIFECLLQAKHWVGLLTYLILSSLIYMRWVVLLAQIHSTTWVLLIT